MPETRPEITETSENFITWKCLGIPRARYNRETGFLVMATPTNQSLLVRSTDLQEALELIKAAHEGQPVNENA